MNEKGAFCTTDPDTFKEEEVFYPTTLAAFFKLIENTIPADFFFKLG